MSTPEEAAAILNESPGTVEQIATRIVQCHEAGQRRSDGSMALHPNRERWYIADSYRLARLVLGTPSVAGLQAALGLAGDEIIAARRKIVALEADRDALIALYSTDPDPRVAMARERRARTVLQQLAAGSA